MTINRFSAPSDNPTVGRNTEGETAGETPGVAPPGPRLRAVPTQFDGQAVLALVGELDTSNTHTVRGAVENCLSRQPDALSLDLSGLTYCGAAGTRSLSWALRRAEADNVEFHIVASPPWLHRVLTAIQARDLLAATSTAD
jgi:stage II sporulation protein AA (anti-sigma F factor antagonist)